MKQTQPPKILSIETSCDECSASVVTSSQSLNHISVLSNKIFSQIDLHKKFGGVVPEIASRNHLDMINVIIEEALVSAKLEFKDLTAVAVTNGPGLIGALLVGLSTAKAIAYSSQIPLITVDHLQGHIHSLFIDGQKNGFLTDKHKLPILICLISGGHTNLYLLKNLPPEKLDLELLGTTRDDAAGEAFDKTAKLLGLPYPGGVHIDRLSQNGNVKKYSFPRPLLNQGLEFSFSGLKTAVLEQLKAEKYTPHIFGEVDKSKLPQNDDLANYCASIQEAICETLVTKIGNAIQLTNAKTLALVGGVSANSRIRSLISKKLTTSLITPDLQYCTDNAAMIGASAYFQFQRNEYLKNKDIFSVNAFSS